jgi:putative ABC transport system permease protein
MHKNNVDSDSIQGRFTWTWMWLESLLRDLSYSIRALARTPVFAAIAILVMALGIGANVALFTIVRSVLVKPLPFPDADRLVRLYERTPDDQYQWNDCAPGVFAEWKRLNRSFTDLALWGDAGYNLSDAGQQLPESVRAATFSWNMLPTLGVQPALGRNFSPDEDSPSANPTVLLSWGLWKRRYGGNLSIVNQSILLDGKASTVIGVMPAWFSYPDAAIQLWTPTFYKKSAREMESLDLHEFRVIGRLKPGVTLTQAVSELSLITWRLHEQHRNLIFVSKAANGRSLLDSLVGNVRVQLYALLAATGCVLLIACLNVSNLLVARAADRNKELAIRMALGGSRLRLLRQHLMESLLLAGAAGAAGFLLAYCVLKWVESARPDMARVEVMQLDGMAAMFTLGLIMLCATFAGLISSISVHSNHVLSSLQEASRANSTGNGRTRLRALLLSLEVGLTVVLLIGAGLMFKSFSKLRTTSLGCITRNVIKMDLDLPQAQYSQPAQRAIFFDSLLARVRGLHGVHAAGLVSPVVPGDGYGGDSGFVVVEHPKPPAGQRLDAIHRWVDPGYFAAIGIPLLRGSTFDDNQRPGHATEVIISESFSKQVFPGEDPVGKYLRTLGDRDYEIVGVVGDTRFSVGDLPQPMMYFALDANSEINGVALMVRSDQDVTALALPIQRIVSQFDRDLPVSDVLTMDQVVHRNTMDASFDATLLFVFAGLSLLLAAVGLFGVLSYIVAQRSGEIGIRVALGAQREQVLRMILIDGLRPAILGLFLGLLTSAAVGRLISSILYETAPLDPAVFAAVSGTLLLVAAIACVLPAWRASRLDPAQAMRT